METTLRDGCAPCILALWPCNGECMKRAADGKRGSQFEPLDDRFWTLLSSLCCGMSFGCGDTGATRSFCLYNLSERVYTCSLDTRSPEYRSTCRTTVRPRKYILLAVVMNRRRPPRQTS